ncbi:MAG: 50S ribosomal protein L1 [Deltaproteobacteria bacterium RIFOXYA12_FULL_58_15]|nr:MAG: 50S ribosomal protein L1 [Deltaproteobacteria bacterium RIFOXYA12_FULL_58_15]OGR08276.1 MAG: 50S ribosomal protein L1 [Deltaproteobacteria bacterium RIFOXYB12_FULL_58_9]
MKKAKRLVENQGKVDRSKRYDVDEALEVLAGLKKAKFDESVDVALKLGVDPRQSDQMVRGVVRLPHGTGKNVRVLVFAKGEKEQEAKDAGADFVGSEELIEKIKGGWVEFDRAIATPDMMAKVGPIAKVLGPRGLMPNPKVGTVTKDVGKAVLEQKAGAVEFRVEKAGIIHAPIGKLSFASDKLKGNFVALIEQIVKAKPAAAKGIYLQSISLSTTMGPGIKIDAAKAQELVKG